MEKLRIVAHGGGGALSWVYILAIGAAVVIGIISYQNNKKKLDSGQIIKRKSSFWEQAEIFTLSGGDWNRVWEELRTAEYYGAASGTQDSQQMRVRYQGSGWTAELYKCQTEAGEKDRYLFQFLHWTERNGVPQSLTAMNTLLTTVEKTFLKIDPQTKVSNEYINIKSRPKFF